MEPSKRSELTDILCVEVTQKLEVLEQTLTVQGIMSNGHLHTPQGPPLTTEQYALLAEHVWGEKAHKGLADARAAIQEAEEYEHQRVASSAALVGKEWRHWIGLLPGQPPENGLEIVAPWIQCRRQFCPG